MEFSRALCPNCGAEVSVEKNAEASVCEVCGKPFITAKAVEAFFNQPEITSVTPDDPDLFQHFYNSHIRRRANKTGALIKN